MRTTLQFVLLATFAIAPGCIAIQNDASLIPEKMEVSCGGFLGDSFAIELKDDHIEYSRAKSPFKWRRPLKISPTNEAWTAFWKEMDAVSIWAWRDEYFPPEGIIVEDGTQWEISITYAERSIDSRGDNAYPSNSNPKATSLEREGRFDRFTSAVALLLGHEFY